MFYKISTIFNAFLEQVPEVRNVQYMHFPGKINKFKASSIETSIKKEENID